MCQSPLELNFGKVESYLFCLDNFYQGGSNTHEAMMLVDSLRAGRTLLPNAFLLIEMQKARS